MSYTYALQHFVTQPTLTLLSSLNNLLKDVHEDLEVTLVGGALRDQHYAWKYSDATHADIKDFDFVLSGPIDEMFDAIYKKLKDNTDFNKFIDSYHSPRISNRGLSGILKFNYLGCECDILLFVDERSLTSIITDFDADVNQVALSWNYGKHGLFYTPAFKKAFTDGTYKLMCREEEYDEFICPEPKLQARELKRLMNLQRKLPRFEMLDFPEFMERLDTIQEAEAEGLLDYRFKSPRPIIL